LEAAVRRLSVPTALLIALVIPLATLTTAAFSDEVQVIASYWLEGSPMVLVRLDIELPRLDAGLCLVLVRGFPAPYNPTRGGWPGDVYFNTHPPGTTVAVKKMLFAHASKYEMNPRTGEYGVGVGSEVTTEDRNRGGGAGPGKHLTCSIVIEYESGTYKRGYCTTWVRGPRVYSIEGLSVSFGLDHRARRSAVYLESFGDYQAGAGPVPESEVRWSSTGKRLTPTVVDDATSPLSGNFADVVYFWVYYRYEYSVYCKRESCLTVWTLYPSDIGGVARSAERPDLPYGLTPYTPPPRLPYARSGLPGYTKIYFDPPYETFRFSLGIFSITISLYPDYTTPYVRINATRHYWWWYRDDNEMSYEVLVAPR